jgi:hypothetical protein
LLDAIDAGEAGECREAILQDRNVTLGQAEHLDLLGVANATSRLHTQAWCLLDGGRQITCCGAGDPFAVDHFGADGGILEGFRDGGAGDDKGVEFADFGLGGGEEEDRGEE